MTTHEYVEPVRFVAGTVGPPGQRTFFLQAHDGRRTTSVSLEKAQVAVLAERLDDLLDMLVRDVGVDGSIPTAVAVEQQDLAPLSSPIDDEFRVAALSLMWDHEVDRVVIEARSIADEDQEDEDGDEEAVAAADALDEVRDQQGDTLRVVLTGFAARAFVARAASVVAAGRPPCPFCSLPLDPEGHICPRQNGYRRR